MAKSLENTDDTDQCINSHVFQEFILGARLVCLVSLLLIYWSYECFSYIINAVSLFVLFLYLSFSHLFKVKVI